MARESKSVEVNRRISVKTGLGSSWASSTSRSGRIRASSRWPALAQSFEAGPEIVVDERDAEEIRQLAVEVADVR